eukprot:TRINITY_DN2793_c0_g1_i2.p1 TRINITY_DN2793_c0_g1~~TRINITY_DN2793_c0_g1_i2.p1  ORF type:complete len:514 (+),score=174.76 TRINITY_DN2793_c0_g1_i2:80-1543(+)
MLLTVLPLVALGAQCSVPDADRVDCGHIGTNQQQCEASGCCWSPAGMGSQDPWCFFPAGVDACGELKMTASGTGFTPGFISEMKNNFRKNLNIDGSGGVVASPDTMVNGGGSYYYHWMRDAGLSTAAFMKTSNDSYTEVKTVMTAYTGWVKARQAEQDPHDISVLTEPKFELPSGEVFPGGWCRPQTDGPALRANSMTVWGEILRAQGLNAEVAEVVELIKTDLGWVVNNWQSNGCDLWEEVQSTDFFWNRMAYVHALNEAAAFFTKIGETSDAAQYKATAAAVRSSLAGHWNGYYFFEATIREVDGSVIHAIASFGGNDTEYGPLGDKAAKTVAFYEQVFCAQYPINNKDTKNGVPGVLIGRYPNDKYGGGNPWQLLSTAMAELYYKVAHGVGAHNAYQGTAREMPFKTEEFRGWREHLKADTPAQLIASAKAAGDSIMTRVHYHVQGNGVVYEQIDKNDGHQLSAFGLTWSYANILNALHMRSKL